MNKIHCGSQNYASLSEFLLQIYLETALTSGIITWPRVSSPFQAENAFYALFLHLVL